MAGSVFSFVNPGSFKNPALFNDYKNNLTLIIIVGILLQMFLPFLIGLLCFPFCIGDAFSNVGFTDIDESVMFEDKIWFAELRAGKESNFSLLSIKPEKGAKPEIVAELKEKAPVLLVDDKRLLIISEDGKWEYSQGKLTQLNIQSIPAQSTKPFVYDGLPAVIKLTEAGGSLLTLRKGQWVEEKEITVAEGSASIWSKAVGGLTVLSNKDKIHLFITNPEDNKVRYCLMPDGFVIKPENWHSAGSIDTLWKPFLYADGAPGIAVYDFSGPFSKPYLVLMKKECEKWAYSPKNRVGIISNLSVMPGKSGDDLIIASRSMPGRMSVSSYSGGQITEIGSYGSNFPFSTPVLVMIILANLVVFLIPVITAGIISKKMELYFDPSYSTGDKSARLASLWKRSIARGIDLVIVFLPAMIIQIKFLKGLFFDSINFFPFDFFEHFIMLIMSLTGCLLIMIFISYLDGRGRTPGKMIMGIKTVRADNLEPCGFLKGFIRNIALLVDGFFTYFAGIGLIAYTQNRQRVGDIAAKTIVIDISEHRG